MLLEIIGKRIRDIRVVKENLNQDEFAKKVGLDRTYLSRLESGKQNITIENLNNICLKLGITLKYFFEQFDYEINDDMEEN